MRKIREIARLYLLLRLSGRAIAKSCGISPSTCSEYLGRIKVAELSWPLPPELDNDAALEKLLFRDGQVVRARPTPDFSRVCAELRRPHVTKMLLWQEYRESEPEGLGYSQFCDLYARWLKGVSVVMRQEHRAGEKLFVDFSGDGIDIVAPQTGEITTAKLFVAVLGASNLTYVEAVVDESLSTWIGCHVRAFEFFGGVPEIVVPDNLKAGVTRPHRYEPELNRTYADLASHYGVAIIPARPRRPRDKAKVEQGVLLAERWIIAALRHHRFSDLEGVNDAIEPLLKKLNERPMRKLGRSRRALFDEMERTALRPLPESRYVLARFASATVNVDYHIEFEKHYYSVPHRLVHERVEVRATATTIEILHRNNRVASHLWSGQHYGYTTSREHMPRSHQAHAEWTPSRITSWAASIGPSAGRLAEEILRRRPHPEQGYRSCLGLIRLAKAYEPERFEAACARALRAGSYSQKSVQAILRAGLDREPDVGVEQPELPTHANVRGPGYYH